ncbi:MAG: DUF4760 domain-containing protein [Terriglobia bacterium]
MEQQKPDHHDAEILLRLYDLRREEKLRAARDWFISKFQAESAEDAAKRYPYGTQENAYFRMVMSYWDMAASLLNHGLINDELFFESAGELWVVWEKVKRIAPQVRELWKNPTAHKNLEQAAQKYEEWMARRAPEALAAGRARMQASAAGAGEKK